jgi:hypothetical protein
MISFPDSITSTALILYNPQAHPLAQAKSYVQKMQELFVEKSFSTQVKCCEDIDINFSFEDDNEIADHPLENVNKSYIYSSTFWNQKTIFNELNIRNLFDMDLAKSLNGNLIKTRTIENNVDIFIFEKRSYLVWNSGHQKRHIYRILEKDETLTFHPISQDEFQRLLKELILNPRQDDDLINQFQKCALELFESKHGDYYLWNAQHFTFPGRDESIIDLFVEIQNLGFNRWVQKQRLEVVHNSPSRIKQINIPIKNLELRSEAYQELNPKLSFFIKKVLLFLVKRGTISTY